MLSVDSSAITVSTDGDDRNGRVHCEQLLVACVVGPLASFAARGTSTSSLPAALDDGRPASTSDTNTSTFTAMTHVDDLSGGPAGWA